MTLPTLAWSCEFTDDLNRFCQRVSLFWLTPAQVIQLALGKITTGVRTTSSSSSFAVFKALVLVTHQRLAYLQQGWFILDQQTPQIHNLGPSKRVFLGCRFGLKPLDQGADGVLDPARDHPCKAVQMRCSKSATTGLTMASWSCSCQTNCSRKRSERFPHKLKQEAKCASLSISFI